MTASVRRGVHHGDLQPAAATPQRHTHTHLEFGRWWMGSALRLYWKHWATGVWRGGLLIFLLLLNLLFQNSLNNQVDSFLST